tara:strand:- start:957 stop:1184 length:228 start_codon:yes stop_codon:yes gene_type:complete
MSTDLKSKTPSVSLTRFFGGQGRGACVQLTTKRDSSKPRTTADLFFDSISVSRKEARTLAADLLAFAEQQEKEDI